MLNPTGHLVKHSLTIADLQPDGKLVQPDGETLGLLITGEGGVDLLSAFFKHFFLIWEIYTNIPIC